MSGRTVLACSSVRSQPCSVLFWLVTVLSFKQRQGLQAQDLLHDGAGQNRVWRWQCGFQNRACGVQCSTWCVTLVVIFKAPSTRLDAAHGNASPGTQIWLNRKPASSFGAVEGLRCLAPGETWRKLVWVSAQEFQSAALLGSQPPQPRLQAEAHLKQAEVRSALQPALQIDPWLPWKDRGGHPAPASRTDCTLRRAAACQKPPTFPSWHLPSSKRASVLLGSQLQHPAHHELSGNMRGQLRGQRPPAAGSAFCWRADLISK